MLIQKGKSLGIVFDLLFIQRRTTFDGNLLLCSPGYAYVSVSTAIVAQSLRRVLWA